MADDRIGRIPSDFIPHENRLYGLAGPLPRRWHHDFYEIPLIHAKFRALGVEPGAGEVIAINDTGYEAHDLLRVPRFTKSMVPNESVLARNFHGLHCGGIAFGLEGLGVAPGAETIFIKVLGDSGGGSMDGINKALVLAAREGATVISCSYGDNGGPPIAADLKAHDDAYAAGRLSIIVAASGNSGMRGVGRPAIYPHNCAVANHMENGGIAPSSSQGPTADIAGPGTNIISCNTGNRLVEATGTSMACPFVAGCFAIIRQWMQINGSPIPQGYAQWRQWWSKPEFIKDAGVPGHDPAYGFGMVRLRNILTEIATSEWS